MNWKSKHSVRRWRGWTNDRNEIEALDGECRDEGILDDHYHGDFSVDLNWCGWKNVIWTLLAAAALEDADAAMTVLLLTGLVDPLLTMGDLEGLT